MDLPSWLQGAVALVLKDMQQPTPLILEASYSPDSRAEYWGTLEFQAADGERFDFEVPCVPDDGSEIDLLVTIATELPWHVSELRQSWGQSRPICPRHTHPAAPTDHDGAAWWACPRDGSLLTPIGRLISDG